MSRRVLIVEDKPSALDSCIGDLRNAAPTWTYERIGWSAALSELINVQNPDLILLVASSESPFVDGFIEWIKKHPLAKPAVAVMPAEATDDLLKAASEIFDDFVVAPPRSMELLHRLSRILGAESEPDATVHEQLMREMALEGLVGRDPVFLSTLSKIPLAARSRGPVLILGETGTGKGLCARAIHNLGPRINFPFVPVDCASLPDHLFENEIFGHVNGAYTDARRDQKGLLALAAGGTLFLDEIDSLSINAQSKLLRFIEERTYRPLGSDRFIQVDVNIVAATNSNLEELVRNREFRSDLFFRLDVFRLYLSPLRERAGDILPLARHFLDQHCAENGIDKTITSSALRKLMHFHWPGNVRQLCNVVQRAVMLSEGKEILASHIESLPQRSDSMPRVDSFRQARLRAIESFERVYVEQLMRECEGNVSRAARVAKKDRRALGRLVKRYGINRESV
jgi:two-component system response regulator GlrR